jgi:hypothetical protein
VEVVEDESQDKSKIDGRNGDRDTLTLGVLYIVVNVIFFQVPASCCKSNQTGCSLENPVNVDDIYTSDCFIVGLEFVQGHAIYLAGVALTISSLMVSISRNLKFIPLPNMCISSSSSSSSEWCFRLRSSN